MEKMLAELSAELIPVVKKAGNGVNEWTRLGADLQKTREQLAGLFTRLDGLALGLEQGKGTAGKLLTETALADEAQKLLVQANQTISPLQEIVTNLNFAVKDVQKGTSRLPEIADVVANETRDLPGLVEQTQTSMRELERLIEALQRHWLVRKYVNKTNPPPLRPEPEHVAERAKSFRPQMSPKGAR
jgi:phospholipid/cholesterol/gamma-HCH transport system substrate-binding protein